MLSQQLLTECHGATHDSGLGDSAVNTVRTLLPCVLRWVRAGGKGSNCDVK